MEYSFLQNFTSLIEIFTAIYVSMLLDNILVEFWTPDYKEKISKLIKEMKIPAISYFVKKVEDNIDENATDIKWHMKRKATFFFVFCISLLLLSGLEVNSQVLHDYGFIIVTLLSLVGLLCFLLGKWAFMKFKFVAISVFIYIGLFCYLYFSSGIKDISDYLSFVGYKEATFSFLLVLSLPILWQIFLIWIYSSVYYGYMHERITKEAYIYGKAYIAYKLKNMAALPKEYEMVAKDFVVSPATEEDNSLNSLNVILVRRLEKLCELPNVLKVFISWIHYNLRGRRNRESEYIEQNGFDYESLIKTESLSGSLDGESQHIETNKDNK